MIKYTITLDGDFITFNGVDATPTEGKKESYRKSSIKDIITSTDDDFFVMVSVDNNSIEYSYKEVENPSTAGVAFVSLAVFRTYMVTNLEVVFLVSGDTIKTINSESLLGSGNIVIPVTKIKTYQTLLSASNATPMNTAISVNGKMTLAESTTITLSNLVSGDEGNIVITQVAANYTVAISPTPYVINAGAGAVVITNGAGSITVLSYSYDGSRLLVNYGANYTNA